MKRSMMIRMSLVVIAAVLLNGCGILGGKKVDGKVGLMRNPLPVCLEIPDAPVEMKPVEDRSNLNAVVHFGLALSDSGKHAEAAQVFLKASEDFRSRGSMLEQDLTRAAIIEHWLAGDLEAVRADFLHLEKLQHDLYDNLNESQTLRQIRTIAEQTK